MRHFTTHCHTSNLQGCRRLPVDTYSGCCISLTARCAGEEADIILSNAITKRRRHKINSKKPKKTDSKSEKPNSSAEEKNQTSNRYQKRLVDDACVKCKGNMDLGTDYCWQVDAFGSVLVTHTRCLTMV